LRLVCRWLVCGGLVHAAGQHGVQWLPHVCGGPPVRQCQLLHRG
jgi:hypothetical protein